jgi:hypothetical protein
MFPHHVIPAHKQLFEEKNLCRDCLLHDEANSVYVITVPKINNNNKYFLHLLNSKTMLLDTETEKLADVPKNLRRNRWSDLLFSSINRVLKGLDYAHFRRAATRKNLDHLIHVFFVEYLQERALPNLWLNSPNITSKKSGITLVALFLALRTELKQSCFCEDHTLSDELSFNGMISQTVRVVVRSRRTCKRLKTLTSICIISKTAMS